ncbi:MAG: hypothetical protein SGBAC_009799 [Bacillariaceae sp.]
MSDALRQDVCKAIDSLPTDCSLDDIKEKLDPLFRSVLSVDDSHHFESKVSPLLIACDRCNSSCLQYLAKKKKEDERFVALIGRPLDPCSDEDLNSVVHHAAISGCVDAPAVFQSLGYSMDSLASTQNAHNDTPMMMAAANGHIDFLKKFHQLHLAEQDDDETIQSILLTKNNSDDSCLSLATCHGHSDVVEFLLTIARVETEILDLCKARLESMFSALKRIPNLTQQHLDRLNVVRKCVDMIEKKLVKQAEDAATQLLLAETDKVEAKKPKGKRRKKKKKGAGHQTTQENQPTLPQHEEQEEASVDGEAKEEKEPEDDGTLQLKTLSDGTIAVAVQGQEEEVKPVVPVSLNTRVRKDSVDEMFQKHLKGKSPEIDAVMDALCLEASMLLYSPHGMALNLSPSQLDAVQGILEKQLVAVTEARSIQDRKYTS